MYTVRPPAVYAHESVVADARYKARLDRVMAALPEPVSVTVYADADLPRLISEGLLDRRVPMGAMDTIPEPILLFNTFRFDGNREERLHRLEECGVRGFHTAEALAGYGPFAWWPVRPGRDDYIGEQICRPCWRLQFQNGCAHQCHYCSLGCLIATMVNVEDYIEQLDRLIAAHPAQETYLLEDDSDVLCLEPELGCLGELIEYFGTLKDRYLIIHTKSANVDWMLDLEHNGNTIIVWSIASPEQARLFEPKTGSTIERIEAARKAEEAGYPIRYKFKPIIPVRHWRQEAAATIDMIFEKTRPDLISLCLLSWDSIENFKKMLDVTKLDPQCIAEAERCAREMENSRCKPFPPHIRAEIYEHHIDEIRRHDAGIPLSISTETPQMWQMLSEKLGATIGDYVCGCGPNSTPGRKKLTCNPYQILDEGPVGGFENM